MKKITSLILTIFVMISFASCGAKRNISETSTLAVSTENTTTGLEITSSSDFTTKDTEPTTLNRENAEGVGGDEITPRKYRDIYYGMDWYVSLLVEDREAFKEWQENKLLDSYKIGEMPTVSFIKYFNISKEDFERAVEQDAQWVVNNNAVPVMSPKDYLNQMPFEVYNADIIYTFDNDIINEYYLTPEFPFCFPEEYEYAIITELYETQTTEFYYPDDHYCTQEMNAENANFEAIKANAVRYLPSDPEAYILSVLQYYEENKNQDIKN